MSIEFQWIRSGVSSLVALIINIDGNSGKQSCLIACLTEKLIEQCGNGSLAISACDAYELELLLSNLLV